MNVRNYFASYAKFLWHMNQQIFCATCAQFSFIAATRSNESRRGPTPWEIRHKCFFSQIWRQNMMSLYEKIFKNGIFGS